MNQLQVDLADMKAFGAYPFNALTKKVPPLKDRLASTTAAGMKKVFQALGCRPTVFSARPALPRPYGPVRPLSLYQLLSSATLK